MSMKRVLSILVCVLLVLSSFCAFAEEEDTIKWGTCVVGIDDYTNAILTGGRDICEELAGSTTSTALNTMFRSR